MDGGRLDMIKTPKACHVYEKYSVCMLCVLHNTFRVNFN